MRKITVILTDKELHALRAQSECDLRGVREQARYLIQCGRLMAERSTATTCNAAQKVNDAPQVA
jgi:hypothetical protein